MKKPKRSKKPDKPEKPKLGGRVVWWVWVRDRKYTGESAKHLVTAADAAAAEDKALRLYRETIDALSQPYIVLVERVGEIEEPA